MARIVRKYGGSSLADIEKIRKVASQLADLFWQGNELVVVVSAMAATTDELLKLARTLNPNPPHREMDMLLSVGERISCSLLALALEAEGIGAVSYTGSQVGIITDNHHGEARIVDIRPMRVFDSLQKQQIVVIAGFQGVSVEKEITTLGRGGSDATAVALAAAIKADRCELMKDVPGILTADPRTVVEAELVEAVDYESALKLASGGVTVLQEQAARLAVDHKVSLGIGHAESNTIGTIVTDSPYDRGDIVAITRIDGLRRITGIGHQDQLNDYIRRSIYRNRWVAWVRDDLSSEAIYSGITIVRSERNIPRFQSTVSEVLNENQIEIEAMIEQPCETWICVPGDRATVAVQTLHRKFLQLGWFRNRTEQR